MIGCKVNVLVIFLSLDLDVIIAILKIIRTHSIMDSTAVSGAAGLGSIPSGCISYDIEILSRCQAITQDALSAPRIISGSSTTDYDF